MTREGKVFSSPSHFRLDFTRKVCYTDRERREKKGGDGMDGQNGADRDEKIAGGELHVEHGKLWHWFDNFWYHYKWHTIFAAVIMFTVLFCTLSMCRRPSIEYYFYYAGPGEFTGVEQKEIVSALGQASGEDGESANVSLTFLFLMTNDQIARFNEENRDTGYTVSGSQIMSNRDLLSDEIMTGNAIVMFFDPEVLAGLQENSGAFLPIRDFAPESTPDEAFSGEYGIDLRYTIFADVEAFSYFPEGTVLAIRNGISALTLFQRDKALENRARYEALVRRWLNVE